MIFTTIYDNLAHRVGGTADDTWHRRTPLLSAATLMSLGASFVVALIVAVAGVSMFGSGERTSSADFVTFELCHLVAVTWTFTWMICLWLIQRLDDDAARLQRRTGVGLKSFYDNARRIVTTATVDLPAGTTSLLVATSGRSGDTVFAAALMATVGSTWAAATIPLAAAALGSTGIHLGHSAIIAGMTSFALAPHVHGLAALACPLLLVTWAVVIALFTPTGLWSAIFVPPLFCITAARLATDRWRGRSTALLAFGVDGLWILEANTASTKGFLPVTEVARPVVVERNGYVIRVTYGGERRPLTLRTHAELESLDRLGPTICNGVIDDVAPIPFLAAHGPTVCAAMLLSWAMAVAPGPCIATATVEETFAAWHTRPPNSLRVEAEVLVRWLPFVPAAHALQAALMLEAGSPHAARDHLETFLALAAPVESPRVTTLALFRRSGFPEFCNAIVRIHDETEAITPLAERQFQRARLLLETAADRHIRIPSPWGIRTMTLGLIEECDATEARHLAATVLGRVVSVVRAPGMPQDQRYRDGERALAVLRELPPSPARTSLQGRILFRMDRFDGARAALAPSACAVDRLIAASAARFVDEPDIALRELDDIVRLHPDKVTDTIMIRALVLARANETAKARAVLSVLVVVDADEIRRRALDVIVIAHRERPAASTVSELREMIVAHTRDPWADASTIGWPQWIADCDLERLLAVTAPPPTSTDDDEVRSALAHDGLPSRRSSCYNEE